MKICPTCKRNYADDLAFCLDDGTQLAPVYVSNLEQTAILPGGARPTAGPGRPPQTATEGSTPPYSYPSPRFREKRGGKLWAIVGGAILMGIVFFVAVAGWFLWAVSNKSDAESTRAASNSPNQNPGDTNVRAPETNADSNSQSPTPETTTEWLNGVWTGDGYQTDTKTRWAVRLTVRDDSYSIDYPDIPCKGTWKLIEKNSQSASFTEVIREGLGQCSNNSHVMVEKSNASEITCRYANEGSRAVIATVVLTRKE